MSRQHSTRPLVNDIRDLYVAKVNALISDDREDIVDEVIAEYGEFADDQATQDEGAAA
jgi:hypothetical protein